MVSDDDLRSYGSRLAEEVDAALAGWVERAVVRFDPALGPVARAAAEEARADVVPRLRALLAQDLDEQRTTPLTILRDAARYPTNVLAAAGVPPVERDRDSVARFPDDAYDLVPATFADLGEKVGEAGIAWGAAKAYEHRRRHGG